MATACTVLYKQVTYVPNVSLSFRISNTFLKDQSYGIRLISCIVLLCIFSIVLPSVKARSFASDDYKINTWTVLRLVVIALTSNTEVMSSINVALIPFRNN